MQEELIWNLIAKKLSGEASNEELRELEKRLKEKPELHYSLQTINDLWKQDIAQSKEFADDAYKKHVDRMKASSVDFQSKHYAPADKGKNKSLHLNRKNIPLILSFSFLLLIVVVFLVINYSGKPGATLINGLDRNSISQISTRNGSKSNVVLPDGTVVKLNAGSKLTYDKDYGNTIREVNLTGEAFFDVVKNKDKPFIIHTKKIDIKVLGTAFNVKSYPNETTTETSLIRGSIEVTFKDRPAEKVLLKPNEKLIVADDAAAPATFAKMHPAKHSIKSIAQISHLNYTKKDSTIIETAWIQNKLVFRDEPFRELALQMERWYSVSIRFEDPVKKELQFTGVFENESIQQALEALKLSGKFNYSIKGDEVKILK
jgi:ferric-dicitrate binding protein FerR (iron transport regulator)